jgi:hypothetical protein
MSDHTEQTPDSGVDDDEQHDDPFAIEYTPARAGRRRTRFEPRSDGPGWWRIEDEWTGCKWRPVGREPVNDVSLRNERIGGPQRSGEATTDGRDE